MAGAYHVLYSMSPPSDPLAKTIWKIRVPAKMKFQLWQLHLEFLPVAVMLHTLIPYISVGCVVCGHPMEEICTYSGIAPLQVLRGLSSYPLPPSNIMNGFLG